MKKKILSKTALILFGAVLLCSPIRGETIEGIVAVVGDRAILLSEVANQVQMIMMQMEPGVDVDIDELATDVLNQIINDELILSAAREDTSVTATPDEIKYELDEHIASIVARFPSEGAFLQQLSQEGLTKRALEKQLRPEIRDQILKQKIIANKLANVSMARNEVENFYNENIDSLPEIPAKIRLAHILIKFKVSPKTDDSLKAAAEAAREIALKGLEFAEVADSFAIISPGAVGGRIGFVRRTEVVEEFGRAAFALQPGSISGPVRTEYGWHVIKNHARRADSVDVSHILFPTIPSAADSLWTRLVVDSLLNELRNGGNFKELAKLHSDDDESRATGGELEEMTVDQLRPEFVAPLEAVDVEGVTPPVISQLGFHILKLLERTPGRPLDIDEDYDIVRNFAQQQKTATLVEEWVNDLKKSIYFDIREFTLK
ncbi:MAG: peptidylprolyl isomerase [candidate division Zixibacteria bacterium]